MFLFLFLAPSTLCMFRMASDFVSLHCSVAPHTGVVSYHVYQADFSERDLYVCGVSPCVSFRITYSVTVVATVAVC